MNYTGAFLMSLSCAESVGQGVGENPFSYHFFSIVFSGLKPRRWREKPPHRAWADCGFNIILLGAMLKNESC